MTSTIAIDTARRGDFLTPSIGAMNVAHILAGHAGLLVVFHVLHFLPFSLGLLPALAAIWVHQRFLSEWAHEAAHYNIVPDKVWNDRIANWLLTYWHGYKIDSYRTAHMRHHSAETFFAKGDPDTERLGATRKSELVQGLLRDISGITAIKSYFETVFSKPAQRTEAASATPLAAVRFLLPVAALHLFFLAASFYAGFAAYYILYVGALLTLYPVMNRIRVYGQHLHVTDNGTIAYHTTASRTIDAGFLDRVFFSSRLMMYHNEHHAKPHLPYRALAAVSRPNTDPNAWMDTRWPLLLKFYRSLP